MKKILLQKDRDKLPRNHHPWVFSGAVKSPPDMPSPGEVVEVCDHKAQFIAYGHYSPEATVRLRLLEWTEGTLIDADWFRNRLQQAYDLRKQLIGADTNAYRLVHSEGDLLPGLIIDVFDKTAVMQLNTIGMEQNKDLLVSLLLEMIPELTGVYEKSDGDGRRLERLEPVTGKLAGTVPSAPFTVTENSLPFQVDLSSQKTGFYTDQRENRAAIVPYVPKDAQVLDLCSFTGAFSVYALLNGAAHATLCDVSADVLAEAKANLALNNIDEERLETIQSDAFDCVRKLRDQAKSYDMIILDPPKLVSSRKALPKGIKAYKDLNLFAMKLLKPSGILVSFSCSGNVTMTDFRDMLAFAAKDADREVQVLKQLHQSPDHPIRLSVPETEYLKGVIARVL